MNIIKRIAETRYARSAIEDKADLSAFKKKPSVRIILGISAMGFSYIIGWPAISGLGAISIYLNKPWLLAIGLVIILILVLIRRRTRRGKSSAEGGAPG